MWWRYDRTRKRNRQLLPASDVRPSRTTLWDRITPITQAFTVIAAFATVFTAFQSIKISNKQANEVTQREITDRFTAAVGELGSNGEEVRLGGIYALERIARDSERDQSVVVEILCAYVRKYAPRPESITTDAVTPSPRQIPTSTVSSGRPETDVQAAVTVVARLELPDQRDLVDLSHANLAGVDLENLSNGLGSARLSRVNLEETDLANARLRKAELRESDLKNAHLVSADLYGGRFARSDLTGAYLNNANLGESIFTDALLSHAVLIKAELSGADFSKAILSRTQLIDAELSSAKLVEANLTGADLTNANLTGANLSGANLNSADLSSADLTNADLTNADLTGARNVTLKQLQPAHIDHFTKLPPGFIWTEHGVQPQKANLPR